MRRWLRGGVVGAGVAAGLLYTAALLYTSLSSVERTLPPGEPLHFCGFYLDCHLSAAVAGLGAAPRPDGAGLRYRVRLRLASDARRATLRLDRPRVYLIDDRGTRLASVAAPEAVKLAAGTDVLADVVFDGPAELVHPRLVVTKGGFFERLSEWFLIGDPESVLHAPATLALR